MIMTVPEVRIKSVNMPLLMKLSRSFVSFALLFNYKKPCTEAFREASMLCVCVREWLNKEVCACSVECDQSAIYSTGVMKLQLNWTWLNFTLG